MTTIVMQCNLKTTQHRAGHSGLFLTKSVLLMRRNCHFWASGQNSDITIRFSDPNFQKRAIICWSDDVFRCFFHWTDQKCATFQFPVNMIYFYPTICGNFTDDVNQKKTPDQIFAPPPPPPGGSKDAGINRNKQRTWHRPEHIRHKNVDEDVVESVVSLPHEFLQWLNSADDLHYLRW